MCSGGLCSLERLLKNLQMLEAETESIFNFTSMMSITYILDNKYNLKNRQKTNVTNVEEVNMTN